MTISGALQWDGIILVGGTLTSNGNNSVNVAVVTGLNVLIGENRRERRRQRNQDVPLRLLQRGRGGPAICRTGPAAKHERGQLGIVLAMGSDSNAAPSSLTPRPVSLPPATFSDLLHLPPASTE